MNHLTNPHDIYPVILAGGNGTRLFPASHRDCPKQFMPLDENHTFIQATALRFTDLGISPAQIVVVTTNDNQTKLAQKQLEKIGVLSQNIVQIGKEHMYGGAMVKAAEFVAKEIGKEAVLINTPSDHAIVADNSFYQAMADAIQNARLGYPTIVGVKVSNKATVMDCGNAQYDTNTQSTCRKVLGFVEKPDSETADKIMRADNTVCNTGINAWRTDEFLRAVKDLDAEAGIDTNELMEALGQDLQVTIGHFAWLDAGTWDRFFEGSNRTPHNDNVYLGGARWFKGKHTNRGTLFSAPNGYDIYPSNVRDAAVVINDINGKVTIGIYALKYARHVGLFAEEFDRNEHLLLGNFAFEAQNNFVAHTAVENVSVGFVGVENYHVTVLSSEDDRFIVSIAHGVESIKA